jgi:ribosomal-protein-alanine N-acetyltransferase
MCSKDVLAVTILSESSDFSSWKKSDYTDVLARVETMAFVATVKQSDANERLTGFLLARLITLHVEILNVAVVEEFRKNGIGKALVCAAVSSAIEGKAESIWLEVRESNLAAKLLYESCGFAVVGRRKKYYLNPTEDALVMTMSLI